MEAGDDGIIIPPSMQMGYYKISFDKYPEQSAAFAVVPPSRDRFNGDTPFASDYASGWLIPDDYKEGYVRAVSLAGISWVRERAEWNRINPQPGRYDYVYTNNYMDLLKGNGIKISVAFHDAPDWAKEPNSSIPHDLFDVYNFMYHAADGIHADAWEFWNEEDAQHFLKEPADVYAAAFKAASIAVSDASPDIEKSFGGFTYNPQETRFIELLMKNDAMHYADAYNYHEYGTDNGDAIQNANMTAINAHTAMKNKYDAENRASWITEAGLVLNMTEEQQSRLSEEQQRRQANYIVTSAVQSLAAGTNRHFWFIFPQYGEWSYEFGIFSPDHQPYPAYVAESVMTSELGCGIIKGKLINKQDVEGYVFDNGRNETCVLVSQNGAGVSFKSDADMVKTDLMGRKTVLRSENGTVTVDVLDEPVYISGIFSDEDYLPVEYPETKRANNFSDADKIVVVPRYQYDNYSAVKQSGYSLDSAADNVMPIEVYNFSDKTMTGSLTANIEGGAGAVTFEEEEITVAPMSKVTVNAVITPGTLIEYDTEYNLVIGGAFGGEKISNCVADISYMLPQDYPVTKFKSRKLPWLDSSKASGWVTGNIVGGKDYVTQNGDGVKFTFDFSQVDSNWAYPYFPIDGGDILNSTGISFTVTSDVDRDDVSMNVFACNAPNTMKYFLGDDPIFIKKGTHRYFIRWDKFQAHVLNQVPGGLDLGQVQQIQIGVNTASLGTVEYTLSDVGTYKVN